MAQIVFENLSFAYPQCAEKALDDINFKIEKGEFVVICGRSGCGKTTLFRQIKTACSPAGKKQGKVIIDGENAENLPPETAACKIGYVMQDPDSQTVTDKVIHELAFGLENLGVDSDTIRLRISEIFLYFGLKNLLDKRTNILSGGEKQLLNLASIMIMKPDIILFDEPTSQLDPVAATEFLSTVSKINEEFGITVIIADHRLEDILPRADRVIVMDGGKITEDCKPQNLASSFGKNKFIELSLPSPMRVFYSVEPEKKLPLTPGEGARRLEERYKDKKLKYITPDTVAKSFSGKNALEIKSLYF